MTTQTIVSGSLAALGMLVCGVLAALGHPIPDVLMLGASTAIGGYFGAVHPTRQDPSPDTADTPPGRHA